MSEAKAKNGKGALGRGLANFIPTENSEPEIDFDDPVGLDVTEGVSLEKTAEERREQFAPILRHLDGLETLIPKAIDVSAPDAELIAATPGFIREKLERIIENG